MLPSDPSPARCPRPELVAAYVDDGLDNRDRARLTEHFAHCVECSAVLAEAVRMKDVEPRHIRWLPSSAGSRTLIGLAASIVVAAGLWFAVGPARQSTSDRWSSQRPELAELVSAVGSRRTFEPRLTGGFAYAPLATTDPLRSGEARPVALPLEIRAAAITLEKRAASADPLALGAFGSAQLATARSGQAVTTFEAAVSLRPKDPRLLSDTAAAYLVRARDTDQIADVARAVGFAQRAALVDPHLAEARFNLALSLEGLFLRSEATKAWQAYLEIDSRSAWAAEAKRRIERLAETPEARWEKRRKAILDASTIGTVEAVRSATAQVPDAAYEYVENDLIPGWAAAWLAGDKAKARELSRRAHQFGRALADTVGERLPLDAAVSLERAESTGGRADALARAHLRVREARALYEEDKVADSADRFREALPDLEAARSPFAGWATHAEAIADYYAGHMTRASAALEPLVQGASARRYLTLGGRALRLRGLLHQVKGDLGTSLDSYRAALAEFNTVRAEEDLAAIHSVISENLASVGAWNLVWRHRQASLIGLVASRTPRRRQTILVSAARTARRQELLDATLAFQNEVLKDALDTGRAGAVLEGYLGRADVYRALGRQSEAAADLSVLEPWLGQVGDKPIADRFRAEIGLAKGEILRQADPRQALDALLGSQAYFRESGRAQRLARIDLALGRTYQELGRPADAETSFQDGIEILERQRARLPSGDLRLEYFNLPWNLFDEMIGLQVRRPDGQASALRFAERSRARELAGTVRDGDGHSVVDPSRLAGTLPQDTAVVYYASLERELLIWVIRAGGVVHVSQPVTSSALFRDVERFRAVVLNGPSSDIRDLSGRLFDLLIRPIVGHLPPRGGRLVVVPDGALHIVPFAALLDSVSGRYLVEDQIVAVAGSATLLVRATSRMAERTTSKNAILVVGNPRLDPADVEGLPPLPGAEAEARRIASLFPGTVLLEGERATRQAFIESAGRYGILHFAGHAITNHTYPLLSHLLFARDSDRRPGILFAHEISELPWRDTSLVVLAACNTGGGAISRNEGPVSLARPFMAAGVPSVVATLWDVSDGASQTLFESFYQALRDGATPALALRDAQLRLLRSGDSQLRLPAAWAGFVALGGAN
jgi:CHAT domain-containing protein/tetratricopeptide (TPR) repeat protein